MSGAIYSSVYQQTVLTILAVLFSSALLIYFFRKKNYYFVVSWASLKSWLFFAPVLFILLGLPDPWPYVVITIVAIYGAKIFFQLMGMFHRSYFVLITYLGIFGLGLAAYHDRHDIYNLLPMIVLGLSCFVPLLRNNYKRMIQYISLTNLSFVFLGWSLMHLALILKLESGIYQLMYLIILTEFCDNTNLAISTYLGGKRLFDRIDHRRTWRGTFVSILVTFALAFAMRHLLPEDSKYYWLTTAAIASLGGVFGDMLMIVIRRDAGIKVVGAFVLGRGDILHRMDRMIFVAPIYYYVMIALPIVIERFFHAV